MRARAGALCLAFTGCNWVYGLSETKLRGEVDGDPRSDLDRDGVADVEDRCIAPATDALGDDDQDGVPNGTDPCPFDAAATADADGDGIPDACDPSARTGDRLRCAMTFSDPDLDVALWKPRDRSGAWRLHSSGALSVIGTGSIVADWPFEGGASTTYDIAAAVGSMSPGWFAAFARAAAVPAATDLGCELAITQARTFVVRTLPGGAAMPVTGAAPPAAFRIQLTLVPGASPSLRCIFRFASAMAVVSATADVPPGRLAFSSDSTDVTTANAVTGITVYERDDAP